MFSICCTSNTFCNSLNEEKQCSEKDFIRYEFGFSHSSKNCIIITKEDDLYNAIIYKDGIALETVESIESPILDWAFTTMLVELENARYNNKYDVINYDLSLSVQNRKIEIDSSTRHLVGDKKFKDKVEKLKSFLIRIWAEVFI